MTLADPPCGYSAAACLKDGATGFTTTELKSNFLAAALEGQAHARTAPVHLGSTTHIRDCDLTSDKGRRVALLRYSQRVLRPKG